MALIKKKNKHISEPEWEPHDSSLIECPVASFLVYSYLYYKTGVSVIEDSEFDAICRHLLSIHSTLTEHPHFAMVTKEALEATSLFNVDKYPTIIKSIGRQIMREKGLYESKV